MQQEIIILQGLPGCGKSTWAKEFVKGKTDWMIINRDSLRNMRGDYWIPTQEDVISAWEEDCINSALSMEQNVIIDATNFNPKTMLKWFKIASIFNAKVTIKEFDTTVEECIERDSKREKPVGESVILGMYKKYLEKDN